MWTRVRMNEKWGIVFELIHFGTYSKMSGE